MGNNDWHTAPARAEGAVKSPRARVWLGGEADVARGRRLNLA